MHTIKIMWKPNDRMEIFPLYSFSSDRREDGSYLLRFEDEDGNLVTRLLKTPGDVCFIMAGTETIHTIRVHDHE